MKLSFIVLQYNTPEETKGCIESIKKKMSSYDGWNIVIVDNGSTIENYNKILDYNKKGNIDVIRIEKNQGFSKGNNFGYKYVKEKYNSEFYYFVSNDIRLLTDNLLKEIEKEFNESKFDVLGCNIINLNGYHTSPFNPIWEYPKNLVTTWIGQFKSFYHKYLLKDNKKDNDFWDLRVYNRTPQGSAICFSRKAFNNLILPYYPETYLYHEEAILGFNLFKKGMTSVYLPQIKMLHKESVSINKSLGDINKIIKKAKKLKIQNDALKVFLKYKKEFPK